MARLEDDMPIIRFSHVYSKFGNWIPEYAELLRIDVVNIADIPKQLLDYDTRYIDDKGNIKHYQLNFRKGILLLFKMDIGRKFTTIRRFTEKKEVYYRSMEGEIFAVEIEGVQIEMEDE